MKAHEFDQKFDAAEDVSDLVDWSKARRKNAPTKRVDTDSPALNALPLTSSSTFVNPESEESEEL